MPYKFRGIVSPPGCWLKVFQFDSCDGTKKPVLSLRGAIILNGKRASLTGPGRPHNIFEVALSGQFEVDALYETSLKYNFANTITRLDSHEGKSVDISKKIRARQTYHGVLIDYLGDSKRYIFLCTSFGCYLGTDSLTAYPEISPDILSSCIVCLRLKTVMDSNDASKLISVEIIDVKCFKMKKLSELSISPPTVDYSSEVKSTCSRLCSVPSWDSDDYNTQKLSQSQDLGLQARRNQSLTHTLQGSQSTVRTTNSDYGTDKDAANALSPVSSYTFSKTGLLDNTSTSSCSRLRSVPSWDSGSHIRRREKFEINDLDPLTLEDFENLQPSLTQLEKLYERHGIYEKPLVTVG